MGMSIVKYKCMINCDEINFFHHCPRRQNIMHIINMTITNKTMPKLKYILLPAHFKASLAPLKICHREPIVFKYL